MEIQPASDSASQSDLFSDMKSEYFSNQKVKSQSSRVDALQRNPVETSMSRMENPIPFEQRIPLTSTASAKLNQQFFVWKNGQAGRLSVDTPFGYKEI